MSNSGYSCKEEYSKHAGQTTLTNIMRLAQYSLLSIIFWFSIYLNTSQTYKKLLSDGAIHMSKIKLNFMLLCDED